MSLVKQYLNFKKYKMSTFLFKTAFLATTYCTSDFSMKNLRNKFNFKIISFAIIYLPAMIYFP